MTRITRIIAYVRAWFAAHPIDPLPTPEAVAWQRRSAAAKKGWETRKGKAAKGSEEVTP